MAERDMPPPLRFLLAARRSELRALETLARTCGLIVRIGALAHALQKERGYSNLYLCRAEARLLPTLAGLSRDAETVEADVHQLLDSLAADPEPGNGRARLLNSIAYSLFRLDELPGLRRRIRDLRIPAQDAGQCFTQAIGSLLAVVFEAADTALDPGVARVLAALLNFMQGKELSGQERACGVMGYTAGWFTEEQKALMRELAGAQDRSFAGFAQCADPALLQSWERIQRESQPVLRLRGMAQRTSAGQCVDAGFAELWFDLCTARIDAMHEVESQLAQALAARCAERIAEARQELENRRLLLSRYAGHASGRTPSMVYSVQGRILDTPPPDGLDGGLERSILDLMREQSRQLRQTGDALAAAHDALDESKRIDRAKRLLIGRHGLTEQAAHERLRRAAMDNGLSLADAARRIVEQTG